MKFRLFTVGLFVVLGVVGYFAFTALDTGAEHANWLAERQERRAEEQAAIDKLQEEQELQEEFERLTALQELQNQENPTPTEHPHQELLDGLQELIDSNINMKGGSFGTRVGRVQKFLNIFEGESDLLAGVDDDYGPGTKERVRQFQRDVGIGADGLAGPETFRTMITWLEENA